MAEVALTIVPLVFSTLKSVEMVVRLFDHSMDAPRQVRQLNVVLSQLSKDLAYFQSQDNPDGHNCIPTDAHAEIKRALVNCRAILNKHYSSATGSRALSGMRQTLWQLSNGTELDRCRAQINEFYTVFVIPGLIRIGHRDGASTPASGEPGPRACRRNLYSETAESIGPTMESFEFPGTQYQSREVERAAESPGRRTRTLNFEPREASTAPTTKVDHIPQTEMVAAETTLGEIIDAEL